MADSFLLDGLQLNDLTTFGVLVDGFQCPPPRERREWIGAADSEAQLLARAPLHENREVTIPIAVQQQATVDLVFDKMGQVVDKLVKASKYPDGITLAWTAHGSSRTINFDVLAGEMPDLPTDWESGFQALSPQFTVVLTCKPYARGTRSVGSTTSSGGPYVSADVVATGDVTNLMEIFVTDTASQSRRHVEWGLEGPLTYTSGVSPSSLIDSDNMVTSGFAGTQETNTGYDPNASGSTNIIVTGGVYSTPIAVCGTGNLSHIGTFRVKGRVASGLAGATAMRLSWKAGDGPMSSNAWVTPRATFQWEELDFGTITIPTTLSGTQRWTGQIEGQINSGFPAGTPVYVDYLVLVPVGAGYGKARAEYRYSAGVTVGFDNFTSTTAGNNLNGRSAVSGGTWATSGDATDFQFADDLSDEQVKRTANGGTNGRFAILGSSAFTDTETSTRVYVDGTPFATISFGSVARWVDSSNYLRLRCVGRASSPSHNVFLEQVVAGTPTTLASAAVQFLPQTWYRMRTLAFASGRAIGQILDATDNVVLTLDGSSTALATGGALDDGKPGFWDLSTSPTTARYYEDFTVATPAPEPIVIYSGRNLQIRYDDTIRQDSTGTYTGRPQSYRGSRALAPVGTSRLLVKARRNDIDATIDPNVTDATQIQVALTPRYLVVPRS